MHVCLSLFCIPSGGMNFENTIVHFALDHPFEVPCESELRVHRFEAFSTLVTF